MTAADHAIAEKMLGAGGRRDAAVLRLALKSPHKGGSHDGAQVAGLAIALFEACPVGIDDDVRHRRKRERRAHGLHRLARLAALALQKRGIPRAGNADLLRIRRRRARGKAGDDLFVADGGDVRGAFVDKVFLQIGHKLFEGRWLVRAVAGELADVSDAVGEALRGLFRVEVAVLVDQHAGGHAADLRDALRVRQPAIRLVDEFFKIAVGRRNPCG